MSNDAQRKLGEVLARWSKGACDDPCKGCMEEFTQALDDAGLCIVEPCPAVPPTNTEESRVDQMREALAERGMVRPWESYPGTPIWDALLFVAQWLSAQDRAREEAARMRLLYKQQQARLFRASNINGLLGG